MKLKKKTSKKNLKITKMNVCELLRLMIVVIKPRLTTYKKQTQKNE
jgi:hypothetical protein